MTSDLRSRATRLTLVVTFLLIALVGLTLALVSLSTPGYAGEKISNPILEAFLEQTPTPIPTPVGAACGVRMIQIANIATDTVSIDLANDGADATIQAITLAWPVANGELVNTRLGGRTIWNGSEAGGSTTIFSDLAQMLPTIKAGEETSMTLEFSNGAAADRYVLLLHLGKSCYSFFDSQQTSSNQSCLTTFDRFFVDKQEAGLVARNTTEEPVSLNRMLIFWPYQQSAINSIRLDDGENLIAAPAERSPAEVELPADQVVTLQSGESVKLDLVFDSTAPLVNYAIALQSDQCQSVFSNAVSPSVCPVRQDGGVQVAGWTAGLILENLGQTSQPLDEIWMTFPASNGALVDVILDDVSIVDQASFPKVNSPASMTAGVDLLPDITLPANTRSALAFVFDQDAASQHYTVELDLSDECRVLSSTRMEEPEPCQMVTDGDDPIRVSGNKLFLGVRNIGSRQAELRALQVDWSTHFNGALLGVSVAGVPFWEGERGEGTATVGHNTDDVVPVIEPGQTAELQLTFEEPAVVAPYVFRLDFAEDCQLSYATQDDLTMPTPIEIGGTIDELPANAFDGWWRIKVSETEVFSVQVTPQTVLHPQGLKPLVGDLARARLLPVGGNDYLATHIHIFPNQAKETSMNGFIDRVVTDPGPGYIVVQGIRVEITEDTVINREPVVGWIAEVGGWERADGSILADRITVTEPQSERRRVDFEGTVDDWQQVSDEESVWMISGIRVVVNVSTTIHHGIAPGETPVLGTQVQVAGDMISASTVEALELWYGPGAAVEEFRGVIRALPEPLIGDYWTIEDSALGTCNVEENADAAACKRVLVTSSTFLDMSQAAPVVGAPVEVSAKDENGVLEALRITILLDEE